MTELLTAAQMRAIEEAAIASGEVTGLELMERAGRGVVDAILEWRPELATAPHRAVVLCGPGNNGGDGFVVARLLKERGWEVEVLLYGDEAKLPPHAAENARRWREMAAPVSLVAGDDDRCLSLIANDAELLVDALFGAGLTRPLQGFAATLRTFFERCFPGHVVAIDAPSGLCLDSGRAIGEGRLNVLDADLTVTFHAPRRGHYLADGPGHCRRLATVDIGLPKSGFASAGRPCRLTGEPGKTLGKHSPGHKYEHGHALVLSGGVGKGGAARLAARGALRVGAGAVTLGVPPAAVLENAVQLDAIMLRPVEDLCEFLSGPGEKMNTVCLGPGIGHGERTRTTVAAACASGRRIVLDADALTSFEAAPQELFALLHEVCVLTPHMGEFGRVFPDIAEKLAAPAERGPAYSRVDAASEAAARAGCVLLLKGADTIIADPVGRAAVNAAHYDRAAPWLATAGAGDVLAGFVAGLLARGLAPFEAAETATWLHVECARRFGPGLIAEDLPEMLPGVFRDLGL